MEEDKNIVAIEEDVQGFRIILNKGDNNFYAVQEDCELKDAELKTLYEKVEQHNTRKEKTKFQKFKAYWKSGWNPTKFQEVVVTSITESGYRGGLEAWISYIANGKNERRKMGLSDLFAFNDSNKQLINQLTEREEEKLKLQEKLNELENKLEGIKVEKEA